MRVEILSLAENPVTETVRGVIVPSDNGYFEVLDHHAPIFSKLGIGKISLLFENGTTREIDIKHGGLIKVQDNKAVILLN